MTSAPTLEIALLSAAILGFRHGFDYDHIAAISDIVSVQTDRRKAMRLSLLYAVGHAATVAFLGSVVIFFQLALPRGVDRIAERLVGVTLVVLGLYVLGSLFGGNPTPRNRFQIISGSLGWIHRRLKSYWHNHDIPAPTNPDGNYDARTVLTIGLVHGLGAETPSQLMIFLLAANLGGMSKGFLGLGMFLAGLLIMNTLMAGSAVGLFGFSTRLPQLRPALTALTAVYSIAVGTLFLFGTSHLLPALG